METAGNDGFKPKKAKSESSDIGESLINRGILLIDKEIFGKSESSDIRRMVQNG